MVSDILGYILYLDRERVLYEGVFKKFTHVCVYIISIKKFV